MRWRTGRRSQNIEDRRGQRLTGRRGAAGGLGIIVVALIAIYLGVDPRVVLQGIPPADVTYEQPTAEHDELVDFVSVVLADTEDTWQALFAEAGKSYQAPVLVLFSGAAESACGFAQSATGPFYCPLDQKVYIDLSFYRELKERFRAPGDFAQAYVIAHEIGHHVQHLLGVLDDVHRAKRRSDQTTANALSVRTELQADCLAGIWAHHADRTRQILEEGDLEEGINAASAIGDDRIQRRTQGYVVPDTFTHGSSEQRVRWFTRGYETGAVEQCNAFEATRL